MIGFTGERYVPSLDGQIKYEHLHRYALCLEFVTSKSVLDLASGEGYGSALLAKTAQSVIGVDIDTESVESAKRHYVGEQNINFLVGSCDSLPLPDQSVEVVTSFETIEHHDKHEEMMQEIKRVLKPGGILIISSPNRLTYSEEPNYSNPFHVKELYYDELVSLLSRHFKCIKIYGQKLATGSFVYLLQDSNETNVKAYTGSTSNLTQQVCSLKSPIYFVAVCSDEADSVQLSLNSVYIDSFDDLLKTLQKSAQDEAEHLCTQLQQRQALVERINRDAVRFHEEMLHAYERLDVAQKQLRDREQDVERLRALLGRVQAKLRDREQDVERLRALLGRVQATWFWKLRNRLQRLARRPDDFISGLEPKP